MLNNLLDGLAAIIWDIDPVIVRSESFGFSLRYYGVLFALALFIGYIIIKWRYKEEGEDPECGSNLIIALMIAIVVGARLGHCLFYEPDRYLAHPIEILYFWKGGLASHGAAVGMILTCVVYDLIIRKGPLRVTTDRLAFGIPTAMVCVRLGNFFNSEIVGAPCDPNSPLAFIFPRYDMTPRYPSQLFEVGMGLVAAVIMFGIYRYYKKRNRIHPLGLPTAAIITAYFVMRFCVEFFKEYQDGEGMSVAQNGHEMLSNGQLYSIPFIIIGLILLGLSLFGPWNKQTVLDYNGKFRVKALNFEGYKETDNSGKALENKSEDNADKSEDNADKSEDNADNKEEH